MKPQRYRLCTTLKNRAWEVGTRNCEKARWNWPHIIALAFEPLRNGQLSALFQGTERAEKYSSMWPTATVASLHTKTKTLQIMETPTENIIPTPRPWANKATTAAHYKVSPRTITNWKGLGLLVYFKIGRVVRFDLAASDALLKENGLI